jgi:glycosyltransferase involved in cell wall biosynthesis
MKKKKVLLKGPLLTNSGYGVHSRQVFSALISRKDIDLYAIPTRWGNTSWILDREFNNGLIGEIFDICLKSKNNISFDESYQVLIPNEWSLLANKNIGITAGFESDIVKLSWISKVNEMDHVIVPSMFTRNAFVRTSLEKGVNINADIEVINEWYYDNFDKIELKEDIFDCLRHENNILVMCQITASSTLSDRKNAYKTISTALEFIRDKKDFGLLLKINTGNYSQKCFEKIDKDIFDNFGDLCKDKVSIISESLSIEGLMHLYSSQKVKCMLSGTRGEGWGLPFVEASSCGLPIISTNYSSYLEFLEEDLLGVDYDLVDIKLDDEMFTDSDSSPKWAEFRGESMLEELNKLANNYDFYKEIAVKRSKIIKQKYSIESIMNTYKLFFEKIEQQ